VDGYRKVRDARDLGGFFLVIGCLASYISWSGGGFWFLIAAITLLFLSAHSFSFAKKQKSALDEDERA